MNIINKAAIKEYANSKDYRISGDFLEAINEEFLLLLDKSITRAEKNGRKTLMSYDK